jgi:CarD family transcriptional regulator
MTEKKAKESGKSKMRIFHVGDLAVYPAHGVGEIMAIESRVVNGEKHDFYIMKVIENGMTIMIPTNNVESVGLRDVINKKEVPKVYAVMKSRKESMPDNQTWNRRYREYMDKIKTGSLYDVPRFSETCSCSNSTKICRLVNASFMTPPRFFW